MITCTAKLHLVHFWVCGPVLPWRRGRRRVIRQRARTRVNKCSMQAPVVVVCVGVASGYSDAIGRARRGGRVVADGGRGGVANALRSPTPIYVVDLEEKKDSRQFRFSNQLQIENV